MTVSLKDLYAEEDGFSQNGVKRENGISVNLEAQFLTCSMSDLMFPFCDSESHFTYFSATHLKGLSISLVP